MNLSKTGQIALFDTWSRYDGERGAFAAYAKSYVYGRFQLDLERKDRRKRVFRQTPP